MKQKYIEIFGDMIDLKDLFISIVTISATSMIMHGFAPANNRPLELLFGLIGTLLGFVVIMLLVKVKRVIKLEDHHD